MNESEIIRLADNGINCFAQIKALAQGQTPGPIDPGPGPTPPPEPVPAGVIELPEMPWVNNHRITSRGAGQDNTLAMPFTTGSKASRGNLPHFNIVEGGSAPRVSRENWISLTPGGPAVPLGTSVGYVQFSLGNDPDQNANYFARLDLNTRYWLNSKPTAVSSTGAYDIDIDLLIADL